MATSKAGKGRKREWVLTKKKTSTSAQRRKKSAEVYEIKMFLADSDPPIWRRLAVRSDMTLARLHDVIQIVMGWQNCHLHQFIVGDDKDPTYYGVPDMGLMADLGPKTLDDATVQLRDIVKRRGSRFIYEYDFGDSWIHELEVVQVKPLEKGARYPVCLGGERAGPPDDCGGVWGYDNLLQAIADPKHEDHDDLLEWLGGEFDPVAFDLDEVNTALKKWIR